MWSLWTTMYRRFRTKQLRKWRKKCSKIYVSRFTGPAKGPLMSGRMWLTRFLKKICIIVRDMRSGTPICLSKEEIFGSISHWRRSIDTWQPKLRKILANGGIRIRRERQSLSEHCWQSDGHSFVDHQKLSFVRIYRYGYWLSLWHFEETSPCYPKRGKYWRKEVFHHDNARSIPPVESSRLSRIHHLELCFLDASMSI